MSTSSTQSRSSNVGPFFFHIEGLPKKYTWQDLKDLIRGVASHGIWTDVPNHPTAQTAGKGYARVQRSDEALNLYQYLTTNAIDNRRLRIHLWDIGGSEARFLRCNCDSTSVHSARSYPAQGLEVTRMAHASGWHFVPSTSPMSSSQPSYVATPTLQYAQVSAPPQAMVTPAIMQAMASLQLNSHDPKMQDPRYVAWYQQYHQQATPRQAMAVQQQPVRTPMYALSASGTPINTTHGLVRTEACSIFVSSMSFKARTKDVKDLFGRAGEVTRCELQKDASTGKSKGVAFITYKTATEAQRAIESFHNRSWMGMTLRVRHDKEQRAVNPPHQTSRNVEPIIVNGSQAC